MFNLSLHYPDQSVTYREAKPRQGLFCVVNPDYEQVWTGYKVNQHASRPTRNGAPYDKSQGLPATARFVDDTPVKFTKELQFFVHAMCYSTSLSDKENKNSFRSMWRDDGFMSNFAGTDTRADYINENGLPPYIQIQPMVCGGSLLKIVGDTRVKHTDCWIVEAVHPDFVEECNQPWLKFYPTNSVRVWYFDAKKNVIKKEEFYNEPLGQYSGNAVVPVFGFRLEPRSSTGYANVIEKYRTRVLRQDEPIPNPFILRSGAKPNPYLSS